MALAALTEGVTDWERSSGDPGYYQLPGKAESIATELDPGDGGGQGVVDLRKALYRSSNTYFFDLGARLGPESMASVARAFGLGTNRSVDVFGARPGLVPDGGWKQKAQGEPWYPGDSLNYAIGQGALLVTPLQLATVAATLANRGRPVRPRFLMASDARLPELAPAPLPLLDQFSQADYAGVIEAMEAVVHRGNQRFGENGTAWAYIGRDIPTAWPGSPARLRWWKSPRARNTTKKRSKSASASTPGLWPCAAGVAGNRCGCTLREWRWRIANGGPRCPGCGRRLAIAPGWPGGAAMSAADFRRTLSREDGFDRRQRWLRRLHLDLPLLVLVLLTAAYGLVVLYSALDGDSVAFQGQLSRLAVAFVMMLIVAQLDIAMLQRWAPVLYGLGIVMLVLVLLVGVQAKGAQRWLGCRLPRFQPSEP